MVEAHFIGELGQIRYVRWTRDPDGGTRFLTFWTDRRFSIDGLIPPRGVDVDGGDLAGLPRPSGMTRVLAMEEAGRPYRTRVYEGAGEVPGVAAMLRVAMRQRGFVEDRAYAQHTAESVALRFDRKGRTVVVGVDAAGPGLVDVAFIDAGGAP